MGGVKNMPKVLIVDDAAFMRMSLMMLLKNNDFEIVGEAENGQIAIEKYLQLKPDIVTMDITMPVMDGIQATKEIMKYDREAKIIVVSAMGQEPYVKEAVVAGAKGFIVKPFKEEFVLKTLKGL
jgi:two-component system chemotaxis response regulator CheY